MKPINKDELYEHLSGFLKAKGIEMKEGSYTQRLQKGCNLLADAVNLGQKGLQKAKSEIDRKLDQMRQVIHEKTAPKTPSPAAGRGNPPPTQQTVAPKPHKPPGPRKAKPPTNRADLAEMDPLRGLSCHGPRCDPPPENPAL